MTKHLTDLQVGRIQGEFAARKHGCVDALARARRVSWATIHKALIRKDDLRGIRKTPATSPAIRARRKAVVALAEQTVVVDGRDVPLHCTALSILNALPLGLRTSKSTVLRDLSADGMVCRVRRRVPTRDPAVCATRLLFARGWTKPQCKKKIKLCVWSDEHTVSINDHTCRTMFVHAGGRVIPRERRRHQNIPRVMIWAAVGEDFKSEIVLFPQQGKPNEDGRARKDKMTFRLNAQSYVRKCLSPVVAALKAKNRIFQHDGASPHGRGASESVAEKFLRNKGVTVMRPWPPYSPDLNMIEFLWPILNARVAALHPRNLAELKVAVKQAWASITQAEINAICRGFKGRCEAVRRAGGACE
jgi:transposase